MTSTALTRIMGKPWWKSPNRTRCGAVRRLGPWISCAGSRGHPRDKTKSSLDALHSFICFDHAVKPQRTWSVCDIRKQYVQLSPSRIKSFTLKTTVIRNSPSRHAETFSACVTRNNNLSVGISSVTPSLKTRLLRDRDTDKDRLWRQTNRCEILSEEGALIHLCLLTWTSLLNWPLC